MLALGKTFLGASRCFCRICYFCVTVCRNGFLYHKNFIANRTMLPFRKTCFGASRRLCCIRHLRVTVCYNGFLHYKNFTANRTVFTLRKTCFGTGRNFGNIDYHGMAKKRNFFESCIFTTRTSKKSVISILGTGRFFCSVFYFSVSECRNMRLKKNNVTAIFTFFSCCNTACCTCRIKGRDYRDIFMPAICYSFISTNITNRIIIIIISVCNNGDFICRLNHKSANRTVLSFGKSRFNAGRFNCCLDHLCVTVCRNDFLMHQNIFATRTIFSFAKSCFSAGWVNCHLNHLCMTTRRNDFLNYKNFTAIATFLSLSKSGFGTGRRNCFKNLTNMFMRRWSGYILSCNIFSCIGYLFRCC